MTFQGSGVRNKERIDVRILEDHGAIAREVAGRIADLVRVRATEGETAILGLATGSTPVGIYRELIRLHRDEGLDFQNVLTFNLDEYVRMEPGSVHSYHRFMRENLFDHVNIPEEGIHMPRGDVDPDDIEGYCESYEAAIRDAGGIDLQILGIGRSGHIGFNEPGSGRDSLTRVIFLDTVTRADAASDFFGEEHGKSAVSGINPHQFVLEHQQGIDVAMHIQSNSIHPEQALWFAIEVSGNDGWLTGRSI